MVVMFAIVYSLWSVAYGYAIYVYIAYGTVSCEKPLQLWCIITGVTGLVMVIALFAIIGLAWYRKPNSALSDAIADAAAEKERAYLASNPQAAAAAAAAAQATEAAATAAAAAAADARDQPTDKTSAKSEKDKKQEAPGPCFLYSRIVLVLLWITLSLFGVVWLIVGTIWTYAGINRKSHSCPESVYGFTYWFIVVNWIWLFVLVALSIVAMTTGGGQLISTAAADDATAGAPGARAAAANDPAATANANKES